MSHPVQQIADVLHDALRNSPRPEDRETARRMIHAFADRLFPVGRQVERAAFLDATTVLMEV